MKGQIMKQFEVRWARREGSGLAALAVAGLLLGAWPAAADDAALQRSIEARLKRAKLDQQAEIHVAVEEGRVILSGTATTVAAQHAAERAALKETKAVENRLKVLPKARSDASIRAAVRDTILRYPYYSVFDSVELGVEEGIVLLRGSVRHGYRKTDIENRVAELHGVREIQNQIAVQSVSAFDDALRYQLVRLIYGDERFVQYAHRANPPIRIIVDNGRVTLTGYVASSVEQALIGHVARGLLSFGVDNQVKVDGEEHAEPAKSEGRDSGSAGIATRRENP